MKKPKTIHDLVPIGRTTQLVLLGCALLGMAGGQPTAPPTFEAASVRQAAPTASGRVRSSMRGGPGTSDPGRIVFSNVTLMSALLRAYSAKPYEVSGPGWMSSERYDVTATIPPGTSKQAFQAMLQRLLTDRFQLASHHEIKQIQGYELVLGKSEPKLKVSTEVGPDVELADAPKTDTDGFPVLSAPGLVGMEGMRGSTVVSFLTARGQPLSALVEFLSKEFRLPVLDKTGLTAKFDFKLEFAPRAPGELQVEAQDDAVPNLVSAIPRQLGLRLEPKKISVDVLFIDRGNKIPAEN